MLTMRLKHMMQSGNPSKAVYVEFRRVSELRDLSIDLHSPEAYFRADDDKLSAPHKRKFFLALERDLQGLNAEAWEFLKGEARPHLKAPHPKRRWQQLFDKLNEAKGYHYLVSMGCENVKFIPRAKTRGVETPDVKGLLDAATILCEVKTINVSDDEINRFAARLVGKITLHLAKGFFDKLGNDIRKAAAQLSAFDDGSAARRIVYVVFNFDDRLHEYADEYQRQIEAYIASEALANIEVVLDVKPPFHSAV
ncbi:MAG: hypothetical protein WCC40_09290 [Rhodomicrobium sp.]